MKVFRNDNGDNYVVQEHGKCFDGNIDEVEVPSWKHAKVTVGDEIECPDGIGEGALAGWHFLLDSDTGDIDSVTRK